MAGKEIQNIGLALGGGAALGVAHVGVLKALEEMAVEVRIVSGTSIGAFVAALMALGVPTNRMREIAHEMDWLDVAKLSISRYGLMSNEKLRKLLRKEVGDATFEDTIMPLAIVATNISNGKKVVIQEGDIATAIMASTALPGLFTPVNWEGQLLVDGGLTENVPITPLYSMGAKITLGVDLIFKRHYGKPNNIVDVLTNAIDIAINNGNLMQLRKADALILPDLSQFAIFRNEDIDALIQAGYISARLELQKIRQLGLI